MSLNIPTQFSYFVLVIILMYTFILFEVSVQLLNPDTRWIVIQILATFLSVTTPLAVILRSEKLSAYSVKYIKEKYEEAFILSIFVVPVILSLCMYCFLYILYWILNIWIILPILLCTSEFSKECFDKFWYEVIIKLCFYFQVILF